eukprot:TRINITY_DN4917_c0_g2_i1.p1 TRINITY_DN4917_c0_g2~~TRINITY_DN4917_c0_g2_i1.p1  ORF type:complete len:147 (-),score=20.20 TRINITY_DN4917_c0_g2_i1:332-772(-)
MRIVLFFFLSLLICLPACEARILSSSFSIVNDKNFLLNSFRFYAGGRAIVNITNYEGVKGELVLQRIQHRAFSDFGFTYGNFTNVVAISVDGEVETEPISFEFEFTNENAGFAQLVFKPVKGQVHKYFNAYLNLLVKRISLMCISL